jgi:glycine/D-amino acid oxidase-like deaminating enzyme
MRDQGRVVIIGAGIVGCSAACYLTQKGWQDVVTIEQGPLFEAGGSTSRAPGLMFQTTARICRRRGQSRRLPFRPASQGNRET